MNTVFKKLNIKLKLYKHLYKSRKELRQLSDEMLLDIGISRLEAELEAAKHFWEIHGDSNKMVSLNLKQKRQTFAEVT